MPGDRPSGRPALLLCNPHSRRGREGKDRAVAALAARGVDVVTPEWRPETLMDVVRAHEGVVGALVVAGGDGSINTSARALLASGLPLGIMPLGTANDLARTLGVPADLDGAAAVIAAGRTSRIDLGMANDVPFFNIASIGFGVDLTRALTRDSKRRWGTLGYAVAGLRALSRMRPFTATIVCAGETHASRTIHLAVGNGRHYGGGMTIAADATVDDHRLDVMSLEVSGWWRLLRLLPAIRSGRHDAWHEIRTLSGADIVVTTRRPRSVNTDGEITTSTPVRFTIRPGAIEAFVPGG